MSQLQQLHILFRKIIRSGIGKSKYIAAAVGLTVAMVLILSAVQIQVNYNELLYGKNNKDSIANFLVLSKVINGNTIDNTISDDLIADLRKQPFVEDVGLLTSSRFKVSAQSPSDNLPFYTDLFFESVPDEFLDVKSDKWKWEMGSTDIPVIIPNQFLDLYNFGFAPSQGLPQLTPSLVMALPIVININYNGIPVRFTGHVVGFSDRISSVLVPDNFLKTANKQFANNQQTKPSRVVIKTKDPGNPLLVQYLKANGLTTDADKTRFSKYRKIVHTIVGASSVTGLVMLLFALLVFSLFIQLTISSAKKEITLLITLGTSPKHLQYFLMRQFMPVNIIIIILSVGLVAAGQCIIANLLLNQNMFIDQWLSVYTILVAILILAVLWIVNRFTIKKYINA